jgi:hypothetical protein
MPPTDPCTRLQTLVGHATEIAKEAIALLPIEVRHARELDARLTSVLILATEIDCERRGPRGEG